MKIAKLTPAQTTPVVLKDLNRLMWQLRGKDEPGTFAELKQILKNPTVVMFVAKDGQKVAGVASLYVMQKVGKRVAHVEDVVVDEAYRGQGLGKKLMRAILTEARKRKVKTVNLTSRKSRTVAHKLYEGLGFELYDTNVYKLKL